jgi:small multidrug resistance pump
VLKWALLGGAIGTEVIATMSLRALQDNRLWLIAVVVGYTTSLFLLTKVWQAGVPVGVAYGIWGAVGTAVTAVMGMVIFDEPLTVAIVIGIGLIIAGVLAVELGSHPEPKS